MLSVEEMQKEWAIFWKTEKKSILKWGEKENAFYSEKGNVSIEEKELKGSE